LINAPRPSTPRTTSSRQGQHAAPATGVRAGTGPTPPGSIPGTPAGRTSRMSDNGTAPPPRGHSSLGQAFDMYVLPFRAKYGGLTERDGRASPSFSNVDYVDHSAELYELPAKVILSHSEVGEMLSSGKTANGNVLQRHSNLLYINVNIHIRPRIRR
jgi:hypothetical protein